jgi:poly(ribitol-phosphate) beta-N-acetylglucosaminyltransferase
MTTIQANPNTAPLVSFCIPTYNRSRYLKSLLESLCMQLEGFAYAYELVIADNASPDDTGAVVAQFQTQLPIRYVRHDENIGCFPNVQFVMAQAAGKYVVYLSDDDCILGEPVAQTIARMEVDPGIAVVFAPWKLFDLVAQQDQGQFYAVPHDLRIEQNQHGELLDHVLRHHIFPEIYIARRDAVQRLMPRINEHAFFAFVNAADYLSLGAVLIQKEPFYVAITRYFADDERSQAGNDEVEVAWDRYRGGLEYMLARAGKQIAVEERAGFHLRIQKMIAVRMSVAVRFRHAKKRNPLDTYYIASRLKGMGYEELLPVPMATLASEAMLEFLLKDPVINRGVEKMITVGPFERSAKDYLKRHASHPISFVNTLPSPTGLGKTLVFVSDRNDDAAVTDTLFAQGHLNMVRERDLLARFSL